MGLKIRGASGLVSVIVSAAAGVDGSIPSYGADGAGDQRGLPYPSPSGRPAGNVVWFVLVRHVQFLTVWLFFIAIYFPQSVP